MYKRFGEKNNRNKQDSHITVQDFQEAETMWIKEAQKDLITPMKDGKLIKLTPQMKDGLIVVGGRVKRHVAATWNKQ